MANKFQIKRTAISGRTPNTTNIANTSYIDAGELAVNLTDQKVFTSNGSVHFEVGSNLSSLSVQTITANGSAGSNGQVLTSNGTTVYWANSTGSSNVATQSIYTYTISSNTSTITGSDDNANTLSYTPGIESIFINGVRQISGVDYNTTNSSIVALTSNVISGDVVQVITWVGTINTVNVNAQYVWTNTHTFSNTVTFSKAISANGSNGTAGQILASNGTAVYWTDANPGDITGVTAGNGLSGGGTSGDVTVSVLANTGLVANADGVFVNTAYIATLSANNATYFDGATWAAPKALGSGTANTGAFTTLGVGNTTIVGTTSLQQIVEKSTLVGSAATGTINFDVLDQAVMHYTTNASANWTINVRGNGSNSLNSVLSTSQSITIAFMATQGSTAYYPSTFQIDSSTRTVKWQGGTAPTAGNANAVDMYVYTIMKTGANTYNVYGAQTKFA